MTFIFNIAFAAILGAASFTQVAQATTLPAPKNAQEAAEHRRVVRVEEDRAECEEQTKHIKGDRMGFFASCLERQDHMRKALEAKRKQKPDHDEVERQKIMAKCKNEKRTDTKEYKEYAALMDCLKKNNYRPG